MTRPSLAPTLFVRRGKQALTFYAAAFGATTRHLVENDAGEVVANLAIGDADFWISDESPSHGNLSPETLGGGTARFVLSVDDPKAVVDRAVAAGATLRAPVAKRHGWLLGEVVDPFGHRWEIGKPPV